MSDEWTGELAPPPFWLRADLEVTKDQDAPKLKRGDFVVRCLTALLACGCSLEQALGVAANTMNETGWGRTYRGWNLGGWKINKSTSVGPRNVPRRWWRALGNKGSGDSQTCFYRAFNSPEDFFKEWLSNFVPLNSTGRYKKTGQEFWAGRPWFDDLIAAGYKGEVTRKNPTGSMKEHEQIIKTLIVMWAQHALGVNVDGDWGPKSQAAAKGFQDRVDIAMTGNLDKATQRALFGVSLFEQKEGAVAPTSSQAVKTSK